MFGGDAFRVKLDAVDGEGFVGEAHDEAVGSFGGDSQSVGQCFAVDN